MFYVYRYINGHETVYVGITNNMQRRVSQHKADKLAGLSEIEFFAVQTRTDAEILETYLINQYKPVLNISKKEKGEVSFLADFQPPWEKYCSKVSDAKPFFINQPVKIIYQTVNKKVSGKKKNSRKRISRITTDKWLNEIKEYFEHEIDSETKVIDILTHMMFDEDPTRALNDGVSKSDLSCGISLHNKRKKALTDSEHFFLHEAIWLLITDPDRFNEVAEMYMARGERAKKQIEEFEQQLQEVQNANHKRRNTIGA